MECTAFKHSCLLPSSFARSQSAPKSHAETCKRVAQTMKLSDAGHALSMTAACHHNAPGLHAEQQLHTAIFSYTGMMTSMPYGSIHAVVFKYMSISDNHKSCPSCRIKVGDVAGVEKPQ